MDIYDQVARNIDHLAENDVNWSRPATARMMPSLRSGWGICTVRRFCAWQVQAVSKHRCWPAPGRK